MDKLYATSAVKGLTQHIMVIRPTDHCTRWRIEIYNLLH